LADLRSRITFFFGAENLRASIADDRRFVDPNLCRVADVVEIDHPFAGTVKVGPEALAAVVKDFAGAAPQR
jgi:hypothetical protein